jgi:hypothetical protein
MPQKLKNPAAKRTPVNYSLELRIIDMVAEKAEDDNTTDSEVVNSILRSYFGIVQ